MNSKTVRGCLDNDGAVRRYIVKPPNRPAMTMRATEFPTIEAACIALAALDDDHDVLILDDRYFVTDAETAARFLS